MPEKRYFLDEEIQEGQKIFLEDQQVHHIVHVMRQKEGQSVELVNGRGALAQAQLLKLEKRKVLLEVQTVQEKKAPSFSSILYQAIPLANRLDNIVEKASELGVNEIRLFKSSLGEALPKSRIERLKAVAVASMKQCGRFYLPKISLSDPIDSLKKIEETSFFGDIEAKAPSFEKTWQESPPKEACAFFIGPESGFDTKEIEKLRALGVKGVKLHDNILRTDTAAILAMGLVSQKTCFAKEQEL